MSNLLFSLSEEQNSPQPSTLEFFRGTEFYVFPCCFGRVGAEGTESPQAAGLAAATVELQVLIRTAVV